HGMSAFEKKPVSIEPAKALAAAGFKVATSESDLQPDTQIVVISAAVRLIYFRKLEEEKRLQVMNVLASIEGAEVLDRNKLDSLGCHNNRSGDLIVVPLPGHTMSRAGASGGQHGRF